jgi:hypothetical protein
MPEILRARSRSSLVATIVALGLIASACGAEDGSAAGDDATEGDAADDVAATENLFPDIDVVNIVDGSTVNLAQELGGGDKPVLLWFWAPH